MWFSAHLVEVFRVREGEQTDFHVWENIVLIEAANDKEAWEKAEVLGRENCQPDDPTLTWNNRPSRRDFVGVRKVITCVDKEQRPEHGTEVSYNSLFFASEADLQKFVAGEEVGATFDDETPVSLDD